MRFLRINLVILVFILALVSVGYTQVMSVSGVFTSPAACFAQTTGTSAQCSSNVSAAPVNTTVFITLSFTTNVCSTINTPTNWTKVGCASPNSSLSAAVYYQTSGAGNANPTFTWTGSSTITGNEFYEEGLAVSNQLDVSTTNTGAATTSAAMSSVTPTQYLDHLIGVIFTDNAASGVTITPPGTLGLMVSFNSTNYDSFVEEQRAKLPLASGSFTSTLSSSSDFVAFTMAFKSIEPPVAQNRGDIVGLNELNCANNAPCLTAYTTAGAVGTAVTVDGSNNVQINPNATFGQVVLTAPTVKINSSGNTGFQVENNTAEAQGTFQITANNAPSATCTGGSTGVLVETANSNCTASLTPFPCCTGNGTGTCKKSNNNTGTVLTSSVASTGCTLTFNASNWLNTETCVVSDGSGSTSPTIFSMGVPTTAGFTVNFTSATSKVFNYVCM